MEEKKNINEEMMEEKTEVPGQAEETPKESKPEPKEPRPVVEGILDIQEENSFGFLRFDNFLTSDKDIYVSPVQIRRFNLKTGDKINCVTRLPHEGERFGALLYVNTVNGEEPGAAIKTSQVRRSDAGIPGQRDLSLRLPETSSPRVSST